MIDVVIKPPIPYKLDYPYDYEIAFDDKGGGVLSYASNLPKGTLITVTKNFSLEDIYSA